MNVGCTHSMHEVFALGLVTISGLHSLAAGPCVNIGRLNTVYGFKIVSEMPVPGEGVEHRNVRVKILLKHFQVHLCRVSCHLNISFLSLLPVLFLAVLQELSRLRSMLKNKNDQVGNLEDALKKNAASRAALPRAAAFEKENTTPRTWERATHTFKI